MRATDGAQVGQNTFPLGVAFVCAHEAPAGMASFWNGLLGSYDGRGIQCRRSVDVIAGRLSAATVVAYA